jgi:hypothetical protein
MEKAKALRLFSEHVLPGRWAEVRQPNDGELKKTMVLRMPLMEASAKIRSGPPIDEESDYDLRVWAGELPLSLVAGEPITDPRLLPGIQVPAYIETVRVRFARARRR